MRGRRTTALWWLPLSLLVGSRPAASAQAQPENAKAILPKARLAFEAREYEVALNQYRRLSQAGPAIYESGAEAHVRIADCLYHLGKYGQAIAAYQWALRDFPRGSGRFLPALKLGDCYVRLGDPKKAREIYRRAKDLYSLEWVNIEQRIERLQGRRP